MKTFKPFARVLGYLISIHLLCLAVLSLCRIVLLIANMPSEGIDWQLAIRAMLIGIKFDNLIACYVSSLPAILLPILAISTMHRENYAGLMMGMSKGLTWYYGILYAILIFVHVANARYFHFFENHLNIGVTAWFGFVGDTAGMVFGDSGNWIYILISILLIIAFEWALVCITKLFNNNIEGREASTTNIAIEVLLTILLWGLVFVGMRGSLQRYPLRVSFAYFCNNPFYNKLGVNPVFNIIKSAEYGKVQIPKEIAAVDEKEALEYVQQQLGILPTDTLRPIVRKGSVQQMVEGKPNVVLIFMESMATLNLDCMENGQWLTPYLRSLREKSIYWSNCYSTGIHTNNGIVGVHYGYVPNFAKPIMDVNADIYTGLPYYMKHNGYRTICFVTGNPQYDNMNSFWRDNHIEQLYSLYDYGSSNAVNNFGVSDTYMFNWGLDKLNEYAESGEPFFASFLTVSNHGPFIVPDQYRDRASIPQQQIIAYADDALRQFMEAAQETEWGKNTLFVLVADHGANWPGMYEMVLSYHRIPVFMLGAGLEPQVLNQPTSQIDIWPTVLSMLGIEYDNNSLGIDVMNEQRRYAFFVSDDHLGVSDGEYFWCYGIQTQRECLYKIGNGENIIDSEPDRAADMRAFGMNMIRVNLLSIEKKWTEPCE